MSNVVVCARCGDRIFTCAAVGRDYSSASIRADDFTPLGDFKAPVDGEQMNCPKCGELFPYPIHDGQVVLKLEGGQWWPHPPLNAS